MNNALANVDLTRAWCCIFEQCTDDGHRIALICHVGDMFNWPSTLREGGMSTHAYAALAQLVAVADTKLRLRVLAFVARNYKGLMHHVQSLVLALYASDGYMRTHEEFNFNVMDFMYKDEARDVPWIWLVLYNAMKNGRARLVRSMGAYLEMHHYTVPTRFVHSAALLAVLGYASAHSTDMWSVITDVWHRFLFAAAIEQPISQRELARWLFTGANVSAGSWARVALLLAKQWPGCLPVGWQHRAQDGSLPLEVEIFTLACDLRV
jgi:hypothetical protein